MERDLNVRVKTVRLSEKYIGVNVHGLGLGNGFLDMILRAPGQRKIAKLYFTKTKNFEAKNTNPQVKRKAIEWQRYLQSYIFDRSLISRINKEHFATQQQNGQ